LRPRPQIERSGHWRRRPRTPRPSGWDDPATPRVPPAQRMRKQEWKRRKLRTVLSCFLLRSGASLVASLPLDKAKVPYESKAEACRGGGFRLGVLIKRWARKPALV